jgi:hypothetical protein
MAQPPLNTPVVLIIFNRPETTAEVFEAIRQAKPLRLLVVADGPRPDHLGDAERCMAARAIIQPVDWDCEVLTNYSETNLGCRERVAGGLNWVFETVDEAIILEDDCAPHPTFFRFCEELLERYRADERVMCLSGNNFQFGRKRTEFSYYFSRYNHIWGWASWRRAWKHFDLSMSSWPELQAGRWLEETLNDPQAVRYWTYIFQKAYDGFNTWDYAWTFACWRQNGLSIVPAVNLVSNIGFGPEAVHTKDRSSKFADMPVDAIQFPLRHPPDVTRHIEADEFTERIVFSGNLDRLLIAARTRISSSAKVEP